jgi:hypothetical protein
MEHDKMINIRQIILEKRVWHLKALCSLKCHSKARRHDFTGSCRTTITWHVSLKDTYKIQGIFKRLVQEKKNDNDATSHS